MNTYRNFIFQEPVDMGDGQIFLAALRDDLAVTSVSDSIEEARRDAKRQIDKIGGQ